MRRMLFGVVALSGCQYDTALSGIESNAVTVLKGYATQTFRPSGIEPVWDWNRCIHDPATAVDHLKPRGDLMGLNLGIASDPSQPWSHWQGIVRLPVDTQRLFVLDMRFLLPFSPDLPLMDIGVMGLARNADGRRIGGNRMSTKAPDWDVAPETDEKFLFEHQVTEDFQHPGGMQALGSFLFIPFEDGPSDGEISIWDMSRLSESCPSCFDATFRFNTLTGDAGVAGVAKLATSNSSDGGYVLVTGERDSDVFEFYVVPPGGTLLDFDRNRFGMLDRLSVWGMRTKYQHVSLLTGCNGEAQQGPLYLLGTTKDIDTGDDFVDLFALTIIDQQDPNWPGSSYTVTAQRVAETHVYCSSSAYNRQCDFDAAGGTYVDPNGRLIVYGAEHDNDGPVPGPWEPGSVRITEFRNVDHLDNPDTSTVEGCPSLQDAFVELYDDYLGPAGFPGAQRSYLAECRDLQRRSLHLGTAHDFEDIARAIRYCIPSGYSYRLFENSDMTGATEMVRGDSSVPGAGNPSNGTIQGFSWATTQKWSMGCFVRNNDIDKCLEQCD